LIADTVTARSGWVDNDGVWLHYLDSDAAGEGSGDELPIVFLPGLSDTAADYEWLLDAWSRRTLILDLRGRGPSDAPAGGYRPEDQAGDLAALLAARGLSRIHLVTFSRGTAYGLTWALAHPQAVVSLAVADYQAKHILLPATFPDHWMGTSWRGRPMTEIMRRHVIEGITRDSLDEPLWDRLPALRCPVLLMRAARGIVDEPAVQRWREALPGLRVELFEASAHDIFKRERDRFVEVVSEFVEHSAR
jgi:pimeloyl-ACP methyl ester carboxylesterase